MSAARYICIFFSWFFASFVSFANAQTIENSDGQPRIELLGSNVIRPGTLRLAKAIFINNGPGDYPFRSSVEAFFKEAVGRRTVAMVPVPETAPCDFFAQDFGPDTLAGVFGPGNGPIKPGEKVECIVGLITFPESPVEFTQTFSASFVNDFNPANNRFELTIRTQEILVTQVPALSSNASILLASACLLFGMLVSRRFLV